jgi:hypothetical protein
VIKKVQKQPKEVVNHVTEPQNKEVPIQSTSSFNLTTELNKVCIPIPLNEVIKIPSFKEEVTKFMGFSPDLASNTDTINVQDEAPKICAGPYLEK